MGKAESWKGRLNMCGARSEESYSIAVEVVARAPHGRLVVFVAEGSRSGQRLEVNREDVERAT